MMIKVLPAVAAAAVTLVASPAPPPAYAQAQQILNRAVTSGGAPGIVAEIRDGNRRWFGAAGVSDTETGRGRQPQERFRIGSTTKAFTATVVLQLVAERKLSLDDTVDRWLVTGHGHDGRQITIRQLLNHTSGVFNYVRDFDFFSLGVGEKWFEHRYDRYTPQQLVQIAMANEPHFAPGRALCTPTPITCSLP